MEITSTSIYHGPSIYAERPVVRYQLQGHLADPEGHPVGQFLEALFRLLPGLRAPSGACSAPDCFETSAAGEVFPMSHLFEHVCIALQNRAGAELACIRSGAADRNGPDVATVPYEEAEVCVESARLACDLIGSLVPVESGSTPADRLGQFTKFAAGIMLPVQDRALIRAAVGRGIPAVRLVGRTIVLGQGRFQQRLTATKTSLTNVVGNDLAVHKDHSRRVLRELGLPVPRYERVYRRRHAVEAASRIGYPVVVKPNDGSMGRAVSVGMRNRREVREAYKRARAVSKSVLVEELVEGDDYRMLVIDGKFCAASRRTPGHVVGDGRHTIEELVDEANRDPRRARGHTSSWTLIDFDEQADRLVTELGYSRLSVPADGEVVYLRRNANMSHGGTAVDVTDDVHPDNRDIAVRAAKAIGLDIAGVDLLTKDISSSLWENGGKINEINSKPGIRSHLWPAKGKPRDVIAPILDMLFPPDRSRRVPIAAVVGTGTTRIVAEMLAHILTAAGHHVGLASQGRVYSGGRETEKSGLALPAAARRILLDPEVDVAVLEVAPDEVRRYGLGCDTLDVAALVNPGDRTRGEGGDQSVAEEDIEAIRVVARAAREVVYVGGPTANGTWVERAWAGAKLCRVLPRSPGGGRAADRGPVVGRCAVLTDESICIQDGSRRRVEIPLATLPERLPGLTSESIVDCAVSASVAALGLGAKAGDICQGLSSFGETLKTQAGKRRARPARRA